MRLEDVDSSPHFRHEADLIGEELMRPRGKTLPRDEPEKLARTVEDPTLDLAVRLRAGQILAAIGDPRPDTTDATCHVPSAVTDIGLHPSLAADVVCEWEHVGVEEDWILKETPVHRVRLEEFWIARYPVTNAQWWRFLRDSGHESRPTTWYLGACPWDRSNHPVAGIEAADADHYALWWSERTGHPWRLPTETEWEYAAKGPEGLEYPWGNTFDPTKANTRETGVHTTTPVGAFPAGASPFGVMDMAGNVEECTSDDYRPYPGGPAIDDHLTQTRGRYRVLRGGGFSRFGDLARTRRRHGPFPSPLYPAGLRLATSRRPPTSQEN
ncbi:formylglycine-generating enzyme family protein [Haloglycomyces albus]|uniref:formylglycine-generating enzyme family protein n=1 Tax=Haloglycomyces albus TaxID=526067 RepID=UPI00046CBF33|nr:SUMF1/EgtB/PvdO family nonheme iron enzyme [Haloglycomyces albus]